MGRELNMDTQRQNFWKESVEKEAMVRLMWYEKYGHELEDWIGPGAQAGLLKKTDEDPQIEATKLPSISTKKYHKRQPDKRGTLLELANSKTGENFTCTMRPVTPRTRDTLYKGFSKEGTGRYEYLQHRNLKKPEDKYEFPMTSGWEYGWRLGDFTRGSHQSPQFGRSRIVQDSFYRRNGII
ncbi:PREDICTED: uncharacterized protein LOC106806444 [Priapulus caudatus]|uniref:Uncharacterized protein LOC106806444 n=1 Tax=Priapulus caudatus TaxID=37621 RepID=A0ABM1DV94_PRICU|nr:PREDICTED: uncharacterized protein LOC106806444 [Priapulus caudatus]